MQTISSLRSGSEVTRLHTKSHTLLLNEYSNEIEHFYALNLLFYYVAYALAPFVHFQRTFLLNILTFNLNLV